MLKKIQIYFLILVSFVFQTAQAVGGQVDPLKLEAVRYLAVKNEEIRLRDLRSSEVYERIHKICSAKGFQLGQFKYTVDSIKQVFNMSNPAELNRVLFSRERLSRELTQDLEDPAFYQVMKDCGYTVEQSGLFVLGLISADLSGKLIGAIGMITFFKRLHGASLIIKAKSPALYYAITSGGIISSAYAYFKNNFSSAREESNNGKNITISSVSDLEKHFSTTHSDSAADAELRTMTLKALKMKMKAIDDDLHQGGKTAREEQVLEDKLHKLMVKYKAIEMS